jgi:hypothetical protein
MTRCLDETCPHNGVHQSRRSLAVSLRAAENGSDATARRLGWPALDGYGPLLQTIPPVRDRAALGKRLTRLRHTHHRRARSF